MANQHGRRTNVAEDASCDNRRPIGKGASTAKNSAKIAEDKIKGKKSKIKFLYDGCDESFLLQKCTGCLPSRPILVPASRDGKAGMCYPKIAFKKGILCQSEYGGVKIDPKRAFNCIKRSAVSTFFYLSEEQKAQLSKAKLQPQKLIGNWGFTEVTCEVKKQVKCDGSVPKRCTNKKQVSCVKVCPFGIKEASASRRRRRSPGKYFVKTTMLRSRGKCLKGPKGCLPSMCTTIGSSE